MSPRVEVETELHDLLSAFENIKARLKEDPIVYERWKAGGYIIDANVISLYPNVEEAVEQYLENLEYTEENEDIEESDSND